jgi:hypothetical protein
MLSFAKLMIHENWHPQMQKGGFTPPFCISCKLSLSCNWCLTLFNTGCFAW